MNVYRLLLVFACLGCISLTHAHVADAIQAAEDMHLDQDITWQRLMYAEAQEESEVSYPGYFYHAAGRQNLKQELIANIEQLFLEQPDNTSIRCQFPARSQYLIQKLKIHEKDLPVVTCSEFDAWINAIQPHKAVFIYATDFMGNPSSMFGHTLLRIDPKDQQALNLVSYAVNYAATVPAEQSWSYAWKGLTGQYPGEYSLMSYYHKVKEYGDFESRDLWEYELKLTPEEVRFLVMHLWEMRQVSFPYYFISDNCAYRLLGLMDLLRPELNLKQQFHRVSIPVESLKALDDAGLIGHVEYRPALETQLLAQSKQHGAELAQVAKHLSQVPLSNLQAHIVSYDLQQQAQILEMAYDDLYLQLLARKVESRVAQPYLRKFLALRSQLDVAKQRPSITAPKTEPKQGHHARRLSILAGQVQSDSVLELGWRAAYHDLIDPVAGYRRGTQLKFLDVAVQMRQDGMTLEHLDLLSVQSYVPIHALKVPLSWGFDLGWQQQALQKGKFDPEQQHGVANFTTQWGYSLALNHQHMCFTQLQTHVQAGQALDQDWRLGIGPLLGCQSQWTEAINSVVTMQLPYWQDQQQWQLNTKFDLQYQFNPQQVLALQYQYEQQDTVHWDALKLRYSFFY